MSAMAPLIQLVPASMRQSMSTSHGASRQMSRLSEILALPVAQLDSIRLGRKYHYRPVSIPKSDGRRRQLMIPSPALKTVQHRLLREYLQSLPVHPRAMAFFRGASTIRNARIHANRTLIATVDLCDFFDRTAAGRVRAFLARQGWHGEALRVLMRICLFRGGLPQGAPTSPCLSNLVNVGLDERLHAAAVRHQALYTRYGDDLTFSWNATEMPSGFRSLVENGIHAAGYEIQPRKGWTVTPIGQRPMVTGLVLRGHGRVSIPWSLRWQIWRMTVRSWFVSDPVLLDSLNGFRGYVHMVESHRRGWR